MLRLKDNTLLPEIAFSLRMIIADLWHEADHGDCVKARLRALDALLQAYSSLARLVLFARQGALT
jgi:hypothetical protein